MHPMVLSCDWSDLSIEQEVVYRWLYIDHPCFCSRMVFGVEESVDLIRKIKEVKVLMVAKSWTRFETDPQKSYPHPTCLNEFSNKDQI